MSTSECKPDGLLASGFDQYTTEPIRFNDPRDIFEFQYLQNFSLIGYCFNIVLARF